MARQAGASLAAVLLFAGGLLLANAQSFSVDGGVFSGRDKAVSSKTGPGSSQPHIAPKTPESSLLNAS